MDQAIILAAGEGRRLRPLTANRPKAMLYVAGKPILDYVLEALAASGIRKIVFIVGYRKEQIFDHVGDGRQFGIDVEFRVQNKQLGTAHALALAQDIAEKEFLVLAGDKLISPATISPLLPASPPALLVRREGNPSRYGVVTVEKGRLTGIVEKPTHPESNLINTGIYVFNRAVFHSIGEILDIPDVLKNMLLHGETVTALETPRTWLDIVYPWDILSLNSAVLANAPAAHNGTIESGVSLVGRVSIGKDTKIHANTYIAGPVVIGDGCEIGPHACILPTTSIANNVVISPFTEIRNSVIGNDVEIATGSTVHDSVIDRGCIIGGHFCALSEETVVTIENQNHSVKIGAILGEACHLGNGVVALPGTIAGNYCQVKSLKLISGNIPDKSLVV